MSNSTPFSGAAAANYGDGPPRMVPGFASLHRMISMLLEERTPQDGRILVLGAGGGLELKALAEAHPGWSLDGVDPSADMLAVAEQATAPYRDRIRLHEGYIDIAPEGPFDAATCILTMHFVPKDQRLKTLQDIHRRLKPGAPFAMAHISFSQTEPERSLWIARHVAFAGTDPANVERAKEGIGTRLSILAPEEEEALLRQAGFTGVSLFYAGLSFRGWVAYAGPGNL